MEGFWRIQWIFDGKISVLITQNEDYYSEILRELRSDAGPVTITFAGPVVEDSQLIDLEG